MMMESILGAFRSLAYRNDDDYVDRAHYFVTSNMLIGMAVLVSFKQFGGSPIECMTPPKFPGSWEDYAESYCWAQDTYMTPFKSRIPTEHEQRDRSKISYYQWVPFFLMFQAACFRLPAMIYKFLVAKSGLTVHDLVNTAISPANIDPEVRQSSIRSLCAYLKGALGFHRRLQKKDVTPYAIPCANLPFSSFYVTMVYLLSKLLYTGNIVLQFYYLNRFMETDLVAWHGWPTFKAVVYGQEWQQSNVFPRVTMCDFEVRGDSVNVQRYSVQCVMVINIFTQNIFILLWFWYVVLFCLTALSLCQWFWLTFVPQSSTNFVSRHLQMSEMAFDADATRRDVRRFVREYIHLDGMLVLRMIASHAGHTFGTDLILELYKEFYHLDHHIRVSTTLTPIETVVTARKKSSLTPSPLPTRSPSPSLTNIMHGIPEDNQMNLTKLRNRRQHRQQKLLMMPNRFRRDNQRAGTRLITNRSISIV